LFWDVVFGQAKLVAKVAFLFLILFRAFLGSAAFSEACRKQSGKLPDFGLEPEQGTLLVFFNF